MSTVVKRAGVGRSRVVGGLVGIAVAGAAVLTAGAPAGATTTGSVANPSGVGRSIDQPVREHDKLPPGARKATGEKPVPGSYGPAFQKPVSTRDVTPRVVGGTPAQASDHPYIVGLQSWFYVFDGNGGGAWYVTTCTGTVLSSTKVLTAGHCTVDLPFGITYVIAGRNDLDSNTAGQVVGVKSTWTHQNFNYAALYSGATNVPVDDVSVLTLDTPLNSAYTPIPLVAQGDTSKTAPETSAKIVGYGLTETDELGILHEATVPIKSDSTCATELGTDFKSDRMLCAGDTTAGIDTCGGDSGGPLIVDGVQVGITDWGYDPCGSMYGVYERVSYYSNIIKEDLTRPSLVNLDWSGDGHSDLLARNADGELIEFSGSGLGSDGFGGFSSAGRIGTGWNRFTKLFRVTDWTGDGTPAIMAMESDGDLFLYTSDGEGSFNNSGPRVGTGWNVFADIMVTNNWTGDGRPNLLGRKTNGDLFLYTSDGNGGWLNGGIGIKIGTGWNRFNTVLTPGEWEGDGHQALIGRDAATGDLLLYKSDGNGGWLNGGIGIKIGTGWNALNIFMCPGDWNGDNMIDLIGRNSAGDMLLYKTDAHGHWLNGGMPTKIDTGWSVSVFTRIF
ncbi:MAG TPA: serine protease [Micromonospora sp.]